MWKFRPGDRVRVGVGFFGTYDFGTLVASGTKFGRPSWTVRLDKPFLFRRELNVLESNLAPLPSGREWLRPGYRVVIVARPLRGITAELIRPVRLLWRRAWLVQLDRPLGGMRRTRVAEELLLPEELDP